MLRHRLFSQAARNYGPIVGENRGKRKMGGKLNPNKSSAGHRTVWKKRQTKEFHGPVECAWPAVMGKGGTWMWADALGEIVHFTSDRYTRQNA